VETRESSPRQFSAIAPLPPMRSVISFSRTRKQSQPNSTPYSPIDLKMASEKKVAENMLWGGRFTGLCSHWPIESIDT